MRKIHLLTAGALLLILSAFAYRALPETFVKLLNRANMVFTEASGFIETKPIENRQMNYEYAVLNEAKDFEARFAIRPLDELIKQHNESKKDKNTIVSVHPNNFHETSFQATVMNISGGEFPTPAVFDAEAVKAEFNADWGATVFVEVGEEFGQQYKYCLVVALHKADKADAYSFYLSDKKETIMGNAQKLFHALKFKD